MTTHTANCLGINHATYTLCQKNAYMSLEYEHVAWLQKRTPFSVFTYKARNFPALFSGLSRIARIAWKVSIMWLEYFGDKLIEYNLSLNNIFYKQYCDFGQTQAGNALITQQT